MTVQGTPYNFLKKGRLTMYKVRVYDKDGNRQYGDPLHPADCDAAFSSFQAAERYVEYRERHDRRCIIINEREEI